MTRHDPAYFYFRADAQSQGYTVLADYFRDYGIVPPTDYGRPAYKDRELTGQNIEAITNRRTLTSEYSIYKSWGEPGETIAIVPAGHRRDD